MLKVRHICHIRYIRQVKRATRAIPTGPYMFRSLPYPGGSSAAKLPVKWAFYAILGVNWWPLVATNFHLNALRCLP